MDTHTALEKVWDYLCLPNDSGTVEAILVLGSYDLAVPAFAAALYQDGIAPVVICSGSGTVHTDDLLWYEFKGEPEADVFARILKESGVAADAILIENESQNTGDNFLFTKRMLESIGRNYASMRIVTKPYMTRRAFVTALAVWPEIQWTVASDEGSLDAHMARASDSKRAIELMVGDLDRIRKYPKRGFSLPQDVPDEVIQAFDALVSAGYTRSLVEEVI